MSSKVMELVTGWTSVFPLLYAPDVCTFLRFQFGIQAVATDDSITVFAP